MKRIFSLLAVTALMVTMLVLMAAPALAVAVKTDGGPPILSGNKTVVTHCNNERLGGSSATVVNKDGEVHGGGDCAPQ